MIQKFNQFINEGIQKGEVSVYEEINTPYTEFLERAQERLDIFKERIVEIIGRMDKTLETAVTEFDDVIVGEPIIAINYDLGEIDVKINTNVPNNDEAWEADESSALELEKRVSDWLSDYKQGIRADILSTPNEDGNCVITIRTYVIDEDNFGDFTDALKQMGKDY